MYLLGSSEFELIVDKKSDTVVVFTHGIYSNAKKAFSLSSGNGYFWDILIKMRVFSNFDFAAYTYHKHNFSNFLEGKDFASNSLGLAQDLHGYLSSYKNVILFGHSQGGLIVKRYACEYYKYQGVFLITLHTPHTDTSISIIRYDSSDSDSDSDSDIDIWNDDFKYKIPHIFCGSINDYAIVTPENATKGNGNKYISMNKKNLNAIQGHSDLNTNPDSGLLDNIENNIFYFSNSGLFKKFIDSTVAVIGKDNSMINLDFFYSKSEKS
jgi:hypothetical protein